jgi:hypothetical protein
MPGVLPILEKNADLALHQAKTSHPEEKTTDAVCREKGCSILGNYGETYRFAGNVVDSLSACIDSEGGSMQEGPCPMAMIALPETEELW